MVKAFDTTFAGTLIDGEVAGQPLDVFLAGDDAEAKASVSKLVEDGGMRSIDAGRLGHGPNTATYGERGGCVTALQRHRCRAP